MLFKMLWDFCNILHSKQGFSCAPRILPFELVMSQILIYGCMNTIKNRFELGIGVETDAPRIYTLRICEI